MARNNDGHITLHLEGLPSNGGDMLASVFANKLDEFRLLFDEAQRCYVNDDGFNELLISNLSHNSPAATTYRTTGEYGVQAMNMIIRTVEEINNSSYKLKNEYFDYFVKLRDFCKNNFNKIDQIWLDLDSNHEVRITSTTLENIEGLLLPDSVSYGSIKGAVLKYSGDTKEKYFLLYPTTGGKVRCVFNEEKKDIASNVVEKNALISGKLKYHSGEFCPYEIDVYDIELLKTNDKLSKLGDIVLSDDSSPGSSVEIIKDIRREW